MLAFVGLHWPWMIFLSKNWPLMEVIKHNWPVSNNQMSKPITKQDSAIWNTVLRIYLEVALFVSFDKIKDFKNAQKFSHLINDSTLKMFEVIDDHVEHCVKFVIRSICCQNLFVKLQWSAFSLATLFF